LKYTVQINDEKISFEIERYGDRKRLTANGQSVPLDFSSLKTDGQTVSFDLNGTVRSCRLERSLNGLKVTCNGNAYKLQVQRQREDIPEKKGENGSFEEKIVSPMPGLVSLVRVKKGTTLSEGDPVLILEAMKMENEIRSPVSGSVRKISVSPGKRVEKGDLLAIIEVFST